MPQLKPDALPRVVQACQANLGEIGGAWSRALGAPFTVAIDSQRTLPAAQLSADRSGSALLIALFVGDGAGLVMLPETSGLLPAWIAQPDATGQSKLTTLAQELGMLLLPDDLAASDQRAERVGDVVAAVTAAQPAPELGCVSLKLTSGERHGRADLVFPVAKGAEAFKAGAVTSSAGPGASPNSASPRPSSSATVAVPSLPPYLESLLQIQVSLSVTLVSKRQPLQRILELGPGSILPFDKPCTEPLILEVSGQGIAQGEAVKIGDKFGLRITSLTLPSQRMQAIRGRGRQG